MIKLNNSEDYSKKIQFILIKDKIKLKKKENNKKRNISNKINESKGQLTPKMMATCKKTTKSVQNIGSLFYFQA